MQYTFLCTFFFTEYNVYVIHQWYVYLYVVCILYMLFSVLIYEYITVYLFYCLTSFQGKANGSVYTCMEYLWKKFNSSSGKGN